MPTINKDCQITNNASSNLAVLDAFNPTEGTEAVYEQDLKLLHTKKGASTIASGTVETVELDDTTTAYHTLYELIFVQPDTLFPIKNTSEMIDFETLTYPPITVSDTEKKNMVLALHFYQTILAFPTSNLALGFAKAVKKGSDTAKSVNDIDDTVKDFFRSTKQYKDLDFNMYVTVMTYVEMYASIWAQSKPSYTYYLYAANDPKQNLTIQSENTTTHHTKLKTKLAYLQSHAIKKSEPPKLIGTIEFNKKTLQADVADPTDHESGYTITFVDTNQHATPLYYDHGQLVSDTTVDVSPICLRGSFAVKSQFTQVATDNEMLPLFCGRVYQDQVIGIPVKQEEGKSDWYIFFHPHTVQEWITLFGQLIMIILGIQMICQGLAFLKKLFNKLLDKFKGQTPPDEEIDQARQEAENTRDTGIQTENQEAADNFSGNDPNLKVPDANGIDNEIINGRNKVAGNSEFDQGSIQNDSLEESADEVNEIAKYGITDELEAIASDINKLSERLNNNLDQYNPKDPVSVEALSDTIKDVKDALSKIKKETENIEEEYSNTFSEETKDMLDEANKAIDELNEMEKQAEGSVEDAEEGDADEDIDFPE